MIAELRDNRSDPWAIREAITPNEPHHRRVISIGVVMFIVRGVREFDGLACRPRLFGFNQHLQLLEHYANITVREPEFEWYVFSVQKHGKNFVSTWYGW